MCSVKTSVCRRLFDPDIASRCINSTQFEHDAQRRLCRKPKMGEDALDQRRLFGRGDDLKLTATCAALDLDIEDESLSTGRTGSSVPGRESQLTGRLKGKAEMPQSASYGRMNTSQVILRPDLGVCYRR